MMIRNPRTMYGAGRSQTQNLLRDMNAPLRQKINQTFPAMAILPDAATQLIFYATMAMTVREIITYGKNQMPRANVFIQGITA